MSLFMIKQVIALFLLSHPTPRANYQIGTNFLLLDIRNFVIDMPVDVCRPGHVFVDLASEVIPVQGSNFESRAKLGGGGNTLEGRRVEGFFMLNNKFTQLNQNTQQ